MKLFAVVCVCLLSHFPNSFAQGYVPSTQNGAQNSVTKRYALSQPLEALGTAMNDVSKLLHQGISDMQQSIKSDTNLSRLKRESESGGGFLTGVFDMGKRLFKTPEQLLQIWDSAKPLLSSVLSLVRTVLQKLSLFLPEKIQKIYLEPIWSIVKFFENVVGLAPEKTEVSNRMLDNDEDAEYEYFVPVGEWVGRGQPNGAQNQPVAQPGLMRVVKIK